MGLFDYLGLGSNAQNVLTGGLTDQPDWNPAQLDAGTNAVAQQIADRGGLSDQEIVNQHLAGTSATMAPATGGAVAQQASALGGDSGDRAAVDQALNERANRIYASQYGQLRQEAEAAAPAERGRLMSEGASALEQQQRINDELNRQQMAVTQQKWGMRNQIIGQLMSGAGAFAGGYAGGKAGKKLQDTPEVAENQYSGNPNSPDFMGPPAPAASLHDRNAGNSWAGPDQGLGRPTMNGFGSGISYQGLG